MSELEKEMIKQAGTVTKEAYSDLVHPTAEAVGKVVSLPFRAVRVLMSPLEKWIINGEESIRLTTEAVAKKLQNTPEEKLCEPARNIAIPAIQQLSYCADSEELRDLYANLLASSMNTDTKQQVHPAYVDIIKQLTPDEAKLLRFLPQSITIYQPLLDVDESNGKGGIPLVTNFTSVGLHLLENDLNICSYIDNLVRLKLIEIPPTVSYTNKDLYSPVSNHPLLKQMVPSVIREGYNLKYDYKVFCLTNFGLSFIKTCCK